MVPPDSDESLEPGEARSVELERQLAASHARTAELEAIVVKQAAQLEVLLEQLRRNSSNSHLPPSSDGPGTAGSTAGKKKSKSKRKRGGQKGRRGAHRQLLPVEQVDHVADIFPDACCGCGSPLPATPDIDPRRYQQVDLARSGRHVTEWRRHEVVCRCGASTLAAYDADVIPSSPFGPRLTAVVVMLTGAYHLSRRRASQLLRELCQIDVSVGSVSNIEARASAAMAAAADEAQREVEAAAVKHTDATTWLQAGVTRSLGTLASSMATVYTIFTDGCRETIRPMFGARVGILVSDRASVFGFWAMESRQICWAHLLRKLVSFSERDGPAGAIGRELLDCAGLVFEYWHGFKDGQLTRDELAVWMRPVQHQLEAVLERAVAANEARLSGSCADILAHRAALWTFVEHEGVEPTNNHAERELRAFVLWRKRSFGSTSERGLRFAERVMTVVHTARKQGKDVLDFLVQCCTAHARGTTPPPLLGLAPAR